MITKKKFGGICFLVCLLFGASVVGAQPVDGKRPAVWILPGDKMHPANNLDFTYLNELHQHGFDVDTGYSAEHPITCENLKKFNCILLTALPLPKGENNPQDWEGPPYREEFLALLDRYMAAGGGVIMLLDTGATLNASPTYENVNFYLDRWGAKLPLEKLVDPATETRHPRSLIPFVYTDNIAASPVSQGVRGIWYPNYACWGINQNFECWGQPLEFSKDWTAVVIGSKTSHSEAMKPHMALKFWEHFTPYVRPNNVPSPSLYGIREMSGGRLALAALNKVFHVGSGTSWIHDRVMLGKGLVGKPSDFDVLLENTLRWLSQPSLEKGTLGGYQQDPLVLKHPHYRKTANEFYPQFDKYENPVLPGQVFRGLVGAQTAYSDGTGTVDEYAAAAHRAGLDFIVFLEDFKTCNAEKFKQLEADCKRLSNENILLIPGYTLWTNLGNHIFLSGYGLHWPTATQVDAQGRLRLQGFDKDGKLNVADDDAKNLLEDCWVDTRNVGYYDFAVSDPGSVPIRNLRLYGILGLMTYRDGKLIEDVTADYLKLTPQGDTPPVCAVDIVKSPQALEEAISAQHYLTEAAAASLASVPNALVYGCAYGSTNVNPSNGPEIKCWAGLQRVQTYAGEPFVTARFRIRRMAWVTSDVGLKEIRIYSDGQLYRRFLLNGAKEFKQTFEWAYDRERSNVLEVIDVNGGRAVSAPFDTWYDANFNGWCGDRQNGELWHGPFVIAGPWQSGVVTFYSIGQTWDGGQGLSPIAGLNLNSHPALMEKDGASESWGPRYMEGYTYASCVDTTCHNLAGEAWNVYAPGVVGNGYSTLGPIYPATQMRFGIRRTEYLPRIVGPLLDVWPMWSEREGGSLIMYEGSMTLLKDMDLGQIFASQLNLMNFSPESGNVPTWAARTSEQTAPVTGPATAMHPAGPSGNGLFPIDRGGYFGVFGSIFGTPTAIFNVGQTPLKLDAARQCFYLDVPQKSYKKGDTFTWRYLYIWDSFKHEERNLARLERIRSYFGLDGKGGSGIVVKQGKLLSQFGLVDLAPINGVVEFEVPEPNFNLDVPLGLRFMGFNPNWAIGQYQIKGYSSGFYSKGDNVYRALATDDHGMVHLAVYTTGVPLTHCVVGHPVQCDRPDLIIEVVKLSDKPNQWRVAVNNPTDQPISTVLRKMMDLPGFDFKDTPVNVPAGGYLIVKDDSAGTKVTDAVEKTSADQ